MCETFCGSRILLTIVYFRICVVRKQTGTDGVMLNNAFFVLFNIKEFHKIEAPIKMKITFYVGFISPLTVIK
jgi:hypothetical protein